MTCCSHQGGAIAGRLSVCPSVRLSRRCWASKKPLPTQSRVFETLKGCRASGGTAPVLGGRWRPRVSLELATPRVRRRRLSLLQTLLLVGRAFLIHKNICFGC